MDGAAKCRGVFFLCAIGGVQGGTVFWREEDKR